MNNIGGVFVFELIQFINIIDQEANQKNQQQQQKTLFQPGNQLQLHFLNSQYPDLITFEKKAYLDYSMFKQQNTDNEQFTYQDLILVYDSDKGQFKGTVQANDVKAKLIDQNLQNVEFEIELKDQLQISQFKIKLKSTFQISNIEKKYIQQDGKALIKKTTITNYLISFFELDIQNASLIAARKRTVKSNEIQKSEIYLVIELEKQIYEFDIENPKGTDKKNPSNTFFMFKNGEELKMTLEERVYRLERDEAAFLESIRQINTNQATSINQFLISRTGGYGQAPGDNGNLDSLIKRKKILQETKIILQNTISIESGLLNAQTQISEVQDLQIRLDPDILLTGFFQIDINNFINMPRGKLTIDLIGYSKFSKDENIVFRDLVFKIQQPINYDKDRLLYIFNEEQWKNPQLKPKIEIDTFYYDDTVKLDVFQKNSTIKSNLTGKGFIELRSISLDEDSIIGVPIFNKKLLRISGYLYVKLTYKPREILLFEDDWLFDLQNISKINKYQYFDSYLDNEFKSICHFGYLQVQLTSVNIPIQVQKQQNNQMNELYLIKIKEGLHSAQIIVASPNRILDQHHQTFFTQTQNLNERISIEFYQILSEEAFNPDQKNNFKNMRLISHLLVPLKYLPFDRDNFAKDHQFLINMGKSGQVSNLGFTFKYQRQVPEEQLGIPLDSKTGGLLFLKMVTPEDFSFHHDKELDKHSFYLEISNDVKQISFQKRLFFNKQSLNIGNIEVRMMDKIRFTFFVVKAGTEQREVIEEYIYEMTQNGLQGISEVCKLELIEIFSWQPLNKPFKLLYDGFPKAFKATGTLASLQQQSAGGLQSLAKFSAKQGLFGGTQQQTGFRVGTFGQQQEKKYILESIILEMELRTSDFSILNSRGQLESGLIQVYFNKDNVLDLLMTKEITENANFEISNVSNDKRSLRETKSFYLNEIDFDAPYTLRTFNVNDVLQLKIKDITDTFASMKLAEIPLSIDRSIIQFIQIGLKQIQISLVFTRDISLMPVQDQQSSMPGGNKLFAKLGLGVNEQVKQQKEASEFQKKLLELNGKPANEQIQILKIFINEQEQKNKQLITKQLRLAKDFERAQKKVEEAEKAKPLPPKPNINQSSNKDFIDINKMLSGVIISKGDQQQSKSNSQQQTINICGCGNLEPKFRGYCIDCLKKLKETFDRYLERFKKIQEEYDQYTGIDQTKAEEKLRLMKNKIEQYEIKLADNDILDVIERHEKIAQSDENRQFAEFKVSVTAMKQQLEINKVKQDIELQDLKKQQDYMEMQVAKKQSQHKDIERDIGELQKVMKELQSQSDDIDKRIVLKKRYVIYQNQRNEQLGQTGASQMAKFQ